MIEIIIYLKIKSRGKIATTGEKKEEGGKIQKYIYKGETKRKKRVQFNSKMSNFVRYKY